MNVPDDEQPPEGSIQGQPVADLPRRCRKPRVNNPGPDPTAEEIAAGLALIRSGWDEQTHRERAGEGEPRERFGIIH
jgi:hypothetical protein